jgi:hypothetical protein
MKILFGYAIISDCFKLASFMLIKTYDIRVKTIKMFNEKLVILFSSTLKRFGLAEDFLNSLILRLSAECKKTLKISTYIIFLSLIIESMRGSVSEQT